MRALAALLVLSSLLSCADLEMPPPEIYAPMCSANSDCPGALKCSSLYAICHDTSPLNKDVAVQLTPPADSGLVQDQRASVSFHGTNQFNATLDDAISVRAFGGMDATRTPRSVARAWRTSVS